MGRRKKEPRSAHREKIAAALAEEETAEAVAGAIVHQQRIGVDALTGAVTGDRVCTKKERSADGCPRIASSSQISPWATMPRETFRKPAMLAPTTKSPGTPHSSEAW